MPGGSSLWERRGRRGYRRRSSRAPCSPSAWRSPAACTEHTQHIIMNIFGHRVKYCRIAPRTGSSLLRFTLNASVTACPAFSHTFVYVGEPSTFPTHPPWGGQEGQPWMAACRPLSFLFTLPGQPALYPIYPHFHAVMRFKGTQE